MTNKAIEGFLLTTNFYKMANNNAILYPEKQNPEGKASIHREGTAIKKERKYDNKRNHGAENSCKQAPQKLGHPGEEKMHSTTKNIN